MIPGAPWRSNHRSRTRHAVVAGRPRRASLNAMREETPRLARRLTPTTVMRARGLQGGPQPPLRSRTRTEIRVIRETRGQPRSLNDIERARARASMHGRLSDLDDAPARSAVHAIALSGRASAGGLKRPPATPPADGRLRERLLAPRVDHGRTVVGRRPARATREPMRAESPPLARRLTTTTVMRARGLQGGPQPPLRSRTRTEIRVIRETRGQPRSLNDIERARARASTHGRNSDRDDAPARSEVRMIIGT